MQRQVPECAAHSAPVAATSSGNTSPKPVWSRSQAGLSAAARRANARSAYRARLPRALRGKPLLLVDDVLTTGATAESAARALLVAGAGAVDVLTLARVP